VTSKKHATMTVQPDGSVLVTGDKPNNDVYEVELTLERHPGDLGPTALRLEVLPDRASRRRPRSRAAVLGRRLPADRADRRYRPLLRTGGPDGRPPAGQ